MTDRTEPVDLTNCDREPIHIPGAILPHGLMVVLDGDSFEVIQAAGDAPGLLGRTIESLLGRGAQELFGAARTKLLRDLCADSPLDKPRHLLDPAFRLRDDLPLDASVHRSNGSVVIELEAADPADPVARAPLETVQAMVEAVQSARSLQTVCQAAAEQVKRAAGYDRVMVYRFLPDDSGQVFAEAREPHLAPFLHLHYPAADIPAQARALYRSSWIRLITQVDYDPAPLTPPLNPRTGRPLNMSQAILRDVSPIHREYLRNMGVDASMSISIICRGKLWGLIACHHYSPRRLPRPLRAVCELFGSVFSLEIEARERSEQVEARLARRSGLQELLQGLAADDDYARGLARESAKLMSYMAGDDPRAGSGGLALCVDGDVTLIGATPGREAVQALADWLDERIDADDGIFATDRIGEQWPAARDYADVGAGVLAITTAQSPRDLILWFRPELIETVKWGGDPTKPVEPGPHGDRLTPRKSFEVWTEQVRGRALPWTPADLDAAFDLRAALLEVVIRRIESAARAREAAAEREEMLMAELIHRVKNTLANVQAIVRQTSRTAASLEDFVERLEARIGAMSKAHSLLSQRRWEAVSVRRLVADELDQHEPKSLDIEGPDVELTPKAGLALSLVIHELATNAAKYGALSADEGRVAVTWRRGTDGGLSLTWRERGGPPVHPPERHGFGTTLIERALGMDARGRSALRFPAEGVECSVELPPTAMADAAAPESRP